MTYICHYHADLWLIRCTSVTSLAVMTWLRCKPMSHFRGILITLSMRPQEFSAHFVAYSITFFPTCYGLRRVPRGVRLTPTGTWLWVCALEHVGVIKDASLLLTLTCYDHGISHTRYITTPGWVVYNARGHNVTPTLSFQGCVIILPPMCQAPLSTASTWYHFLQLTISLPVS